MSSAGNVASPSNFESLFQAALAKYAKKTGQGLVNHPLAVMIDRCDSPVALLAIYEKQALAFDEFRNGDPKLIKWLAPVVNGLHALTTSAGISAGASLAFPPAKAIFAGIGVLLSTAKYVRESYDVLVDVFECIDNFLRRLMIYTEIPPTPAMTEIVLKIMVELLNVLALATKQINQGRLKKYASKLLRGGDVEAVLQRLDRLTLEESRTTVAQTLEVIYGLVNNMEVVMEGGKSSTDDLRQALVLMQDIATKVNKMERDRLQKDFRRWLSASDPWTNHNIARKTYHNGTAAWFIEGKIFHEWKSAGSLLWIYGLPGSGKSVLCSTIIEDVQDMCQAGLETLAFFYFDFRDATKQDSRSLLSSLLVQLCRQSDKYSEILSSLHSSHDRGNRQPSEHALMECLKTMLQLPGQGAHYIIVDALDECPNSFGYPAPREQALVIMRDLIELRLPNVHFCITSRPEVDIRDVLEPLSMHNVSLHEQSGQNQDIVDYVNYVVSSDPKIMRWRGEDKEVVIKILTQKAGGMFRWVYCQFETLRRCFPPSIRRVLDELPKTLDETYERALLSIDEEKRDYAYCLFQCLVVSFRPLRVEELAELFTTQPNAETSLRFDAGWRPENPEEFVLAACSTLVAVVNIDGHRIVQFSHFSVREYLTSARISISGHARHFRILQKQAHTLVARACLSVLLQLDERIDDIKIQNFPLASYAAKHWVGHAQFETVSSDIQEGMEYLFDKDEPHFATWIWLYDVDRPSRPHMSRPHPERPDAVPLYYAALCGFFGIAKQLVDACPQDVSSRGGSQVTPLHAALHKGHLNIALLLLECGADVESRGTLRQTPLHIASHYGYTGVVRSLIACGADVSAEKDGRETPLYVASRNGRLETAKVLLKHEADANHGSDVGGTPLHAASENGHDRVAQLLLDHTANVDAQDVELKTPLHRASAAGNATVAMVLLEHRANVSARDLWGRTALHEWTRHGCVELVRALLDLEADANARGGGTRWTDGQMRTPLHDASRLGHLEIARLLLDRGADVNAQRTAGRRPTEGKEGTALHDAAQSGHVEVARLLLDRGADVNARGRTLSTALHLAAEGGHRQVVRLLLERGGEPQARDQKGEMPFQAALTKDHREVARLLSEHVRSDA